MYCRVCDSSNLELVLDLGLQPWCNHFLKIEDVGSEPVYPLRLVYCHGCTTVQLDYTVNKEIMFSDHTYLSGTTKSLSDHFLSIAKQVDRQIHSYGLTKTVLDIGSNDGTQLIHFHNLGFDILGVESSKTSARIAVDQGIPTLNVFFNLETAHNINKKFSAINASGVFFHLEELHSVAEGIRHCLDENGIFVVQFLYMKRILENVAFDQVYHEHLLYYNLQNIEILLNRHGLALYDCYMSDIHGGSMIAFVTHQNRRPPTPRLKSYLHAELQSQCNDISAYHLFAHRVEQMKRRDLQYLHQKKQQGKIMYGLGAPVKGNTLLNYFGIGTNYLTCLVEKNKLRRGLYSPGKHLPVVLEDELKNEPDIYYVLAWNFKKEILSNNRRLLERGIEFYFPVDAGAA
jgi:SAM-dependent methyltransferase